MHIGQTQALSELESVRRLHGIARDSVIEAELQRRDAVVRATEAGLSQHTIAAALGVSRPLVQKILRAARD